LPPVRSYNQGQTGWWAKSCFGTNRAFNCSGLLADHGKPTTVRRREVGHTPPPCNWAATQAAVCSGTSLQKLNLDLPVGNCRWSLLEEIRRIAISRKVFPSPTTETAKKSGGQFKEKPWLPDL